MESFDVFDTLLTRAVGSPWSAFHVVGTRLADTLAAPINAAPINAAPTNAGPTNAGPTNAGPIQPAQFADARMRAERDVRRQKGWQEVDLDEIYAELSRALDLSDEESERVMALECEVEGELLRVVPGAVERVQRARAQNGRVLFVSDMYLPADVIRGWLVTHDLWADGDRLFVSNEAGCAKADGALFDHVLQSEGLDAAAVTHHGNHPQSDIAVAKRHGLSVAPFLAGNLNRYEVAMEALSRDTDGLTSALAAASRLARLHPDGDTSDAAIIRRVSAGVLAPTVTAFVLWLLRRAQESGLERLYFLARDGQILVDVARRLAPRVGVDCEFHYLHASRQSWHLPGIHTIGPAQLDWICMRYDSISIEGLLRRVGLQPEEVEAELAGIGLDRAAWQRHLTQSELAAVRELVQQPPMRDRILDRAAQARETLIGYLTQEGVLDDGAWALVDVGWNARLQGSLGEVLAGLGKPAPRGYYFALASRPAAASCGSCEAYAFDLSTGNQRTISPEVNLPTLMEIACAADHGTVDGFTHTADGYAPILRSEHNQPALDWGLSTLQETLRRFADVLLIDERHLASAPRLLSICDTLLRAFWVTPEQDEAEVWGQFPFENEQAGGALQPIARPYRLGATLGAMIGRRPADDRRSVSSWHQGSLALSTPSTRVAERLSAWLRDFLPTPSSGS